MARHTCACNTQHTKGHTTIVTGTSYKVLATQILTGMNLPATLVNRPYALRMACAKVEKKERALKARSMAAL